MSHHQVLDFIVITEFKCQYILVGELSWDHYPRSLGVQMYEGGTHTKRLKHEFISCSHIITDTITKQDMSTKKTLQSFFFESG